MAKNQTGGGKTRAQKDADQEARAQARAKKDASLAHRHTRRSSQFDRMMAYRNAVAEVGMAGEINEQLVAKFNAEVASLALSKGNPGLAGQTFEWVKNRCVEPLADWPASHKGHKSERRNSKEQDVQALGAKNPYKGYFDNLLSTGAMWAGTAFRARNASAWLVANRHGYIVAKLIAQYEKGVERGRLMTQPRDAKTGHMMTTVADPIKIGWQLAQLLEAEVTALKSKQAAIDAAEKQEREELSSRRSDRNLRKALRQGLRENDYAEEYAL